MRIKRRRVRVFRGICGSGFVSGAEKSLEAFPGNFPDLGSETSPGSAGAEGKQREKGNFGRSSFGIIVARFNWEFSN